MGKGKYLNRFSVLLATDLPLTAEEKKGIAEYMQQAIATSYGCSPPDSLEFAVMGDRDTGVEVVFTGVMGLSPNF